jgi:hypothetical protein
LFHFLLPLKKIFDLFANYAEMPFYIYFSVEYHNNPNQKCNQSRILMKKTALLLLLSFIPLCAEFKASVSPIDATVKKRMVGKSWHQGCPVPLKELRYLRMSYLDFKGKTKQGEMVVHKNVAEEVVRIFKALYEAGYPIRQMHLVSDFGGNDWQSIEADNTSAFNCRRATGSKKWSKHSYGKAIDINPIENPYVARNGRIAHKASLKYRKRVHKDSTYADRAVLLKEDQAVQIFRRYGWRWGGDWQSIKDYQHFSK